MTDFATKDTAAWRLLEAMEAACTEAALAEFGNLQCAAGEAAELLENAGRLAADGHIHGEKKGDAEDKVDFDTLRRLSNRRDLSLWGRRGSTVVAMLKHVHAMKNRAAHVRLDEGLAAIFTADRSAADAAVAERAQSVDWKPEREALPEIQKTTAWALLDLLYSEATDRHAEFVTQLGVMARDLSKQATLNEGHLFTMRRHHLERSMEAYDGALRELDALDDWLSHIKRAKLELVNDWDFTRGDAIFARAVFAPDTLKPATSPTP